MSIGKRIGRRFGVALAWPMAVLALSGHAVAQSQAVTAAVQEQRSAARSAAQSQTRIDRTSDQTSELLGEYRVTTQAVERARTYNNHLEKLVGDQQRIIDDLNTEIDGAVVVEQEIVPLMLRMIDDLDQFIDLDLPFQVQDRKDRINRLRTRMDDANLSVSEKYRQIMEAYQIEAEFGRTTADYKDTLTIDGAERQVDILRMGRLVLAYQSADQTYSGFWDKSARQWVEAPNEYRPFITEGLKIARKQAPPNLLRLPIPAPEAGQ